MVQILSNKQTHTYESYKSHQRELVDGSDSFLQQTHTYESYKSHQTGSWWMVQILSTNKLTVPKLECALLLMKQWPARCMEEESTSIIEAGIDQSWQAQCIGRKVW